jgi:poly(3-hydroxybutyrate) depolymerase
VAFDAHADRNGYLAVYPDCTGTGSNSWDAGGCCSTALALNVNDVAFGRAIVADLVAAAAPYAGSPYFGTVPFAPQHAVPMLHIHSVDDPLAIRTGGVSGEGTFKTPVLQQLGFWWCCGGSLVRGMHGPGCR